MLRFKLVVVASRLFGPLAAAATRNLKRFQNIDDTKMEKLGKKTNQNSSCVCRNSNFWKTEGK